MANATSSAMQFNEEEIVHLLTDLSDAKAPSGFEDAAIDIVRDFVEPFATVEVNSLRCAFITPKNFTGEKPVVMLDAHGDEVGMMVMSVRDNGCLSFVTLGGINDAVLTGEKVYVHTVDGSWIPGVIGLKPPHFMSAAEKASGAHGELLIDVGATSRADAIENFGVAVGEPVVFATQTEYDAKHRIAFGKAFDCRVGVVAMLLALRELAEMDLDVDVVAALSSQEEVGDRGIASSVRRFEPAVCYMFEGAPADDTFTQSCDIQCALHKGPMFSPLRLLHDHQPALPALRARCGKARGHPRPAGRAHRRRHQRRHGAHDGQRHPLRGLGRAHPLHPRWLRHRRDR